MSLIKTKTKSFLFLANNQHGFFHLLLVTLSCFVLVCVILGVNDLKRNDEKERNREIEGEKWNNKNQQMIGIKNIIHIYNETLTTTKMKGWFKPNLINSNKQELLYSNEML